MPSRSGSRGSTAAKWLQLLPLTNQQHIDFVQCTFARADTWALWQDSFPEDKPMESLLDILKLGFRGYRHRRSFRRRR